jgi:hypothetical protein
LKLFLLVVLHGCPDLSYQNGTRDFENRVLSRIFGRKLQKTVFNAGIFNFFSLDIISMTKSTSMRWAGHVARMGKNRNIYKI